MQSTPNASKVLGRSVALFAATTALGALAPLLTSGASRLGSALGLGTAAMASTLSLGFLALTWNRAVKQLVAALAVGFLVRMLMVAAGLLVALKTGAEPLAFAAGFFGLYLAHQTIEILMLVRTTGPDQLEGKA